MKLLTTQRAVLMSMARGCRLVGSGLGGATLLDGPRIADAISYQTHQALIRRGLVARDKSTRHGDTAVCDWHLTERGKLAARVGV